MLCSRCESPMTLLFISFVCDYCERPNFGGMYRGYVVWRHSDDGRPHRQYVFATFEAAERWQKIRGLVDADVRDVLSREPFRWHQRRGLVKNLELADKLFEVYPDHRFKPGPNRAFLAPRKA
jgi:hypothetical protein